MLWGSSVMCQSCLNKKDFYCQLFEKFPHFTSSGPQTVHKPKLLLSLKTYFYTYIITFKKGMFGILLGNSGKRFTKYQTFWVIIAAMCIYRYVSLYFIFLSQCSIFHSEMEVFFFSLWTIWSPAAPKLLRRHTSTLEATILISGSDCRGYIASGMISSSAEWTT